MQLPKRRTAPNSFLSFGLVLILSKASRMVFCWLLRSSIRLSKVNLKSHTLIRRWNLGFCPNLMKYASVFSHSASLSCAYCSKSSSNSSVGQFLSRAYKLSVDTALSFSLSIDSMMFWACGKREIQINRFCYLSPWKKDFFPTFLAAVASA